MRRLRCRFHAVFVCEMSNTLFARSLLTEYVLNGLSRCWMPTSGQFSYRFRFTGVEPHNESVPESDAFYTLNVLLGLSRVSGQSGYEYLDITDTFYRSCRTLVERKSRAY